MFTFKLTDESGEETEVKADSRDVLVWEKTSRSNERYMDLLTEMSLAKFYRLAWIAAKRQGAIDVKEKIGDFETGYVLELDHEEVLPTNGDPNSET